MASMPSTQRAKITGAVQTSASHALYIRRNGWDVHDIQSEREHAPATRADENDDRARGSSDKEHDNAPTASSPIRSTV
jgi:type IV secretory pathway VirD2 relaxase